MDSIKLILGIIILIICILILTLVSCIHFFNISRPVFVVDNIAEISILSVVSMLMGLLLIVS